VGSKGGTESYLTPEARARIDIDPQLEAAGWVVQDYWSINLAARYILDLLARVVTVSVETMTIVDALPPLDVLVEQ
jgi:hypothetical protein